VPWFKCKPVDESFLESAPMRLVGGFEIAKPAAEVWAELCADDALHWCRILNDVRWTSPRPFGVGTTREVKALHGANMLRERYFRWEEGRRHSFYVEESSGPLFRALAEDYLVEPRGADACRFVWTIAVEQTLLGKAGTPVNRAILKTLFTDTARHYGLGQADIT
jgi:Polyketide cyclase / dehydrase and lipid transport